jgi:hypothetical protein
MVFPEGKKKKLPKARKGVNGRAASETAPSAYSPLVFSPVRSGMESSLRDL